MVKKQLLIVFVFFLLVFSISLVLGATYEGSFDVDVVGGTIVVGGCQEDWSGSGYGTCINDIQTFICFDKNVCGTDDLKPSNCLETRACGDTGDGDDDGDTGGGNTGGGGSSSGGGGSSGGAGGLSLGSSTSCTEKWECEEWSNTEKNCGSRVCEETNNCGTENLKPVTDFSCSFFDSKDTTGDSIDGILWLSKGKASLLGILLVLVIVGIVLAIFLKKKGSNVVEDN